MTEPTTAEAHLPATATGNIYQRIVAIMREIETIPKDRKNTQQGYNFRGIDDIYNFVHPIMAKHGVFMSSQVLSDRTEERKSTRGSALIYRIINARYRFTAEDGSYIETDAVGEGMDSGDKAANKAMSVSQKYAILQVFLVPTDDPKDPENDSPEVAPRTSSSDTFFDTPAGPDPWAYLAEITKAKNALKKLTGSDDAYYVVLSGERVNHANEIPVEARPALLERLREEYRTQSAKAARK